MIDSEAMSAALRAAFVDAGIMHDGEEATEFCDKLCEVVAQFCQPLEEEP